MTRPTVGTQFTVPASRTRYRSCPSSPVPPGYFTQDGFLWTKEQTGTITSVRKVRGGFKCGTTLGFSLRLTPENVQTYLPTL